jgi:hypothetical protein
LEPFPEQDVTVGGFPWITKRAHEALLEARDRLIEAERDRRTAAETRLALLEGKYADLLDRTLPQKPAPKVLPDPIDRAPDALMKLATEAGGRDAALRRHLVSHVLSQRKANVDDETIADELTRWTDPDPDGDDDGN